MAEMEAWISEMKEQQWFSSPKSNQAAAEGAIQQSLSRLGVEELPVRWIHKHELGAFIDHYQVMQDPLWAKLYPLPQHIQEAAAAKGIEQELAFSLKDVPEYLFHTIYDGAYQAFEEQGERVIEHAVAAGLYVASLSAAWHAACEQENPLSGLLEALRLGYLPLGVKEDVFYLY